MRWDSLAGRLFKWVFGWYLLLAVMVTGVQLGLEYAAIRSTIAADLAALGRSFAPGVSDALWTYDRLLLESLAKGIAQTAIVTGVRIENSRGETVAQQGTMPAADDGIGYPAWASYQFQEIPLRSSPLADNQSARPLGRLVLYSDRRVALDRVAYSFLVILINSLIKTAGLWLIFYLVISWKLSRPLTALSDAVSKLTPPAEAPPALLPPYPYRDEIGALVEAL
ncbi:MAG: hypothetical protein FIA97_08825, partial [Methylococcaceae bacterium]|nr:hypothetical protein [Methylococcaceae bacterium]